MVGSAYAKKGQRLFGSISLDCPECKEGKTYVIETIWGESGWYADATNKGRGDLIIPHHFTKELVQQFYRELLSLIPEDQRIAIVSRK